MPKVLIGASPKIKRPPQSPGFLSVLLEVKIIGSVGFPSANILDPLLIVNDPLVLKSPRITVPASIVSVVLSVT